MARGGYTFEDIKQMDYIQLLYIYNYQELAIKEQQNFLTNVLGVVWNKDVFKEQVKTEAEIKNSDEIFIPLSLAVNPNVMDFVRAQFGLSEKQGKKPVIAGGDYSPKGNEVIQSMADLSKDDFLKMMGKRK